MIVLEELMFFSSSWSDDQSDLKNFDRDRLGRFYFSDRENDRV